MARRKKSRRPMSRKNRKRLLLLSILIIIVLAAADRTGVLKRYGLPTVEQGAQTVGDYQRYHDKYFTVVKIVDGDTLDLGVPDPVAGEPRTRVRLLGVDTPETRHPRYGVMYYGPEATAFAKEVLLDKEVQVVLDVLHETRGKYGRLLAYIYLSPNEMFNEMQIEQGYGYADPRFDHVMKERFLRLGKKAEKQKRGLWKELEEEDLPYWMKNN